MGYDADLTDAQWELVAPYLPPAKTGGRPRTTSIRWTVEAIFYLLKTGCYWRMLPADFPPWRTVYGYCADWAETGVLRRLQRVLYFKVRSHEGRHHLPTVAVIDSQTVATGKMGGVRGYDGGKKKKSCKRHIVVDVLGMMIGIRITAADVHDTRGGEHAIRNVTSFLRTPTIKKVYADKGYRGERFANFVRNEFNGAKVRIGENKTNTKDGFVPDRKRWVVERTFAWLFDNRRLIVDHERRITISRGMERLAAIRTMVKRLLPAPLLAA